MGGWDCEFDRQLLSQYGSSSTSAWADLPLRTLGNQQTRKQAINCAFYVIVCVNSLFFSNSSSIHLPPSLSLYPPFLLLPHLSLSTPPSLFPLPFSFSLLPSSFPSLSFSFPSSSKKKKKKKNQPTKQTKKRTKVVNVLTVSFLQTPLAMTSRQRSPRLLTRLQAVTPAPTSTPPTLPYPPHHHRPLLHGLTSPVSTLHPHHSHRHPLTALWTTTSKPTVLTLAKVTKARTLTSLLGISTLSPHMPRCLVDVVIPLNL